jgi:hypothetical protein
VVPGFGYHGGGLEQHPEGPQAGINRDQVLGVNSVTLGRVTVASFDPPFGVLAIEAHVPVPRRAGWAGHRIAAADDADHQVPGHESGSRLCFGHLAEGFVPDDEPVRLWRRRPVLAVDDLQIGAADANRQRLNEDRPVISRRLGHVRARDRALLPGNDGDGTHALTLTPGGHPNITRQG